MPALLTRISGSPSAVLTRATMASTWVRSETSQTIASARRPSARIAAAVSSNSLADRAATATSAPADARDNATERPMPRPPPVTRAIRPVSAPLRRAGFHRRGQRGASVRFHRVDADRGLEGAKGGGDAGGQATAAPGNQHGVDLRQVLQQLETDGAIAGHHTIVVEGVNEHGIDTRIASIAEGLPPAVERHLDYAATEALDRLQLGVGRVIGRDHRTGDAQPARVPGGALCHVAGAGNEDALGQLRLRHPAHRIGGTANLERSDGLEVLQLEINLGGSIPDGEPHPPGADGRLGNEPLRSTDFLDTKPGRLHIGTVWPVPVSRARRTR